MVIMQAAGINTKMLLHLASVYCWDGLRLSKQMVWALNRIATFHPERERPILHIHSEPTAKWPRAAEAAAQVANSR